MHRSSSMGVRVKAAPSSLQSSGFAKRNPKAVSGQRAPQAPARAVLGVLSENEQHRRSSTQGVASPKCAAGAFGIENALPPGKSVLLNCSTTFSAKPAFAIYVDEVEEEKDETICSVTTEVESRLNEIDIGSVKQRFCLFLDLSTDSPMLVDTSLQSQPENLDAPVDILAVTEYAEDIYQYLREAEVRCRPKFSYMRKQLDITDGMRAILVDWLVEVGEEYRLRTETLYLAVNYLDRFLSCMSVLRGKLQLVGTAAVLLASKYEEIYPPEIDEFVYITDDAYTKKQLLRMEHLLLKVLTFDLAVPTTNQFLMLYLKRHEVCGRTENLAMYVAELSLLEADPFLKHVPSLIAAAAYCLANYMTNRVFWPDSLAAFTGYSLSEIVPCLSDLHKTCLNAPHQDQRAIREKYKASKYMNVSLIEPPPFLPIQ